MACTFIKKKYILTIWPGQMFVFKTMSCHTCAMLSIICFIGSNLFYQLHITCIFVLCHFHYPFVQVFSQEHDAVRAYWLITHRPIWKEMVGWVTMMVISFHVLAFYYNHSKNIMVCKLYPAGYKAQYIFVANK